MTDTSADVSFTPPTRAQWLESALAGLGAGRSFEALQQQTLDGLTIQVLYDHCPDTRALAASANAISLTSSLPSLPGADEKYTWDNRAFIQTTEPVKKANGRLKKALLGGNTSAELHVTGNTDLNGLLDGILLDIAVLSFRAGGDHASVSKQFHDKIIAASIDPEHVCCYLNADPIGELLSSGRIPHSMPDEIMNMARFSHKLQNTLPQAKSVLVDVALHHNAGASASQELHAAIATATLYLQALLDTGMSVAQANSTIVFQMACDADTMMGVVKLRSLRCLWQHVLQQFDVQTQAVDDTPTGAAGNISIQPLPTQITAETSRRYLTRLEPWNNHLRNIAACTAAAMAGADTIMVHPHDRADNWQSDEDPEIGLRMARNLPIILEREAGLTGVTDPMAGAYAVESLTTELTELTWASLAEQGDSTHWLERITSGDWQSALALTHQQRLALMQAGQQIMVGVNRYSRENSSEATTAELTESAGNATKAGSVQESTQKQSGIQLRLACDAVAYETQAFEPSVDQSKV